MSNFEVRSRCSGPYPQHDSLFFQFQGFIKMDAEPTESWEIPENRYLLVTAKIH